MIGRETIEITQLGGLSEALAGGHSASSELWPLSQCLPAAPWAALPGLRHGPLHWAGWSNKEPGRAPGREERSSGLSPGPPAPCISCPLFDSHPPKSDDPMDRSPLQPTSWPHCAGVVSVSVHSECGGHSLFRVTVPERMNHVT